MANDDHIALLRRGWLPWNMWRLQNPIRPDLTEADLSGANLFRADLSEASLSRANLSGANLCDADLRSADLRFANLSGANLSGANLNGAFLGRANLSGAHLRSATLVSTNLGGADLTGCRIYGVSAWRLITEGAKQQDLIITTPFESEVTVDNIEVAQFIYLLLHNEKSRDVIDTIGKKGVLLLGRFTEGRMQVLERLTRQTPQPWLRADGVQLR